MSQGQLCSKCMKRPVFIKKYRLCKIDYQRQWRASQGPESKYAIGNGLRRARLRNSQ